jgi:hypothetical protein
MKHSNDARRSFGEITAVLGLCAVALAGCGNPVIDSRIEALGEEDPAVAASEFHRAGQPCVLCHSSYEGASPEMVIGGTVFATIADQIPVEGVTIKLTDALGQTFTKPTNCVGNFFITTEEWNPAFPLRAEITYNVPGVPDPRQKTMGSRISRDGSCATCHDGPRTQISAGWIFCEEAQPAPPFVAVPGCQGTVPPPIPPAPP